MKFHSITNGIALCGAKKGMGFKNRKDFKFAMKWNMACKKCVKMIISKPKSTPSATTSEHC